MSEARIVESAAGDIRLSGVLDYRSGPALREQGQALIRRSTASALILDCSAVEKSSSVGLALLLALMRDAQAVAKSLSIRGLPTDMRQIAQVCGLVELLPLET